MKRDDSGYMLPMTLVTITLLAFAALLTGRTLGAQLRASIQERLLIEERITARNAAYIMDAWMADPKLSKDITTGPVDSNGWQATNPADPNDPLPVWRTPVGSLGCAPPTNETCWMFTVLDPTPDPGDNPKLRGGEAEQDTADIIIEIRSGCVEDIERCQRTTQITRTYERAVFAQYQLHYDTNRVPPVALYGPDGQPDDPRCATDPTYTGVCDDPAATYGPDLVPDDPRCATDPTYTGVCDGYDQATLIVFTDEDTLNGPLRYSGDGPVLYCGSPDFRRIEAKNNTRPEAVAGCASSITPDWEPLDGAPAPAWGTGLNDPSRFTHKGDLSLPALSTPPSGTTSNSVDYHHRHAGPGATISDGDIIVGDIAVSDGDVTIERLCIDGSATIYSERDIIVRGDIKASGSNDADGPNVIALIAKGDVILAPSAAVPPECDSPADTNLTLTNVAILAPNGAVYASEWHQSCAPCPQFILEGSIAANHLGLYGIPDPSSGGVTNGWSKHFTYPTNFWRARPPWWPGHDSYPIPEWQPV